MPSDSPIRLLDENERQLWRATFVAYVAGSSNKRERAHVLAVDAANEAVMFLRERGGVP